MKGKIFFCLAYIFLIKIFSAFSHFVPNNEKVFARILYVNAALYDIKHC